MTIPNALAFARNYQIPNTKLSPPLLLHCAPLSRSGEHDIVTKHFRPQTFIAEHSLLLKKLLASAHFSLRRCENPTFCLT